MGLCQNHLNERVDSEVVSSGSPREENTGEEVDGCCVVKFVGRAFESNCSACIRILKLSF